ncbi:MAG: hypothetical protein BWK80_26840 [Desulfobacteraceae bacterium IS3]|nr:MAG: hypothetical protein BWK80_26840 [Desulfobacteraceae bacterium IS3]
MFLWHTPNKLIYDNLIRILVIQKAFHCQAISYKDFDTEGYQLKIISNSPAEISDFRYCAKPNLIKLAFQHSGMSAVLKFHFSTPESGMLKFHSGVLK